MEEVFTPVTRTAEEAIKDIRTLLDLAPDKDVVEEVRKLQTDWRHRGAVLVAARIQLEPALRMLKRSEN